MLPTPCSCSIARKGLLDYLFSCMCAKVKKKKLKDNISKLMAGGATNLSAAIECATELIQGARETRGLGLRT